MGLILTTQIAKTVVIYGFNGCDYMHQTMHDKKNWEILYSKQARKPQFKREKYKQGIPHLTTLSHIFYLPPLLHR